MSSRFTFQLFITGPSGEKSFFEIKPGLTLIGRQPTSNLFGEQPQWVLVLDQRDVSRNHAMIVCEGQECWLTDLNSTNGTRLGGRKIQPMEPYRLTAGEVILIGDFTVEFVQSWEEVPEPIAPVIVGVPVPEPGPESTAQPQATETALVAEASPVTGCEDDNLLGLCHNSHLLMNYLPEIYQTDFMVQFLGLFESILLPVMWNIENFDLYLSPKTAPNFFLPWLANWYGLVYNDTWKHQWRQLLEKAPMLYARRGTPWALACLLEIYTGQKIHIRQKSDTLAELQHRSYIDDTETNNKAFFFTVRLCKKDTDGKVLERDEELIRRLIMENKPAYTEFTLRIEE